MRPGSAVLGFAPVLLVASGGTATTAVPETGKDAFSIEGLGKGKACK
jgi:hypothetical protein